MGLVYAELTLKNPSDGTLQPMNVTALVDSGASTLCLPPHIAFQLRLPELHKRETTLGNGTKQLCPFVGPVYVKFENRETLVGALVLGEQVLLGVLPMEDMDVLVHPLSRRLIPNPDNPNVQTALVMSADANN